jgi:hypothetical protein
LGEARRLERGELAPRDLDLPLERVALVLHRLARLVAARGRIRSDRRPTEKSSARLFAIDNLNRCAQCPSVE